MQKSKIDDLKFYDLRHTFGSQLAFGLAHPKMIQRIMGHKSIAMTMRYVNLADEELERAANILEDRMSGNATSRLLHVSTKEG